MLRRLPAAGPARAGARAAQELLKLYRKIDPLGLRRRRERADRRRRQCGARAAAAERGRTARGRPSRSPRRGCARARSTSSPCCRPSRPCSGRGPARAGAACAPAGGRQPVSGARRRLAAAGSGGAAHERDAMTLKRRIISFAALPASSSPASSPSTTCRSGAARRRSSNSAEGGKRGAGGGGSPATDAGAGARGRGEARRRAGLSRRRRHRAALNTVTVRSQVDGKLIKIAFTEGQDVEKGYVLAKIDPRTYQAQYDQAVAKKAQDEAQLANARIDLERYTRLAATNAGQQAAGRHPEGAGRAARGAGASRPGGDRQRARDARATPTSSRRSPGAPASAWSTKATSCRRPTPTGIVVITQLRPISVFFTLPQQQLPERQQGRSRKARWRSRRSAPTTRPSLDRGKLRVVDNQVDQTTGTMKLKAEFPNADLQLWPGPVRQCAAAGRHAEAGRGGADRRRPARAERHVRLCRQGRQHRRGAAGDGRAAGRRAGA